MKKIKPTGKYVKDEWILVDDENYDYFNQWKWFGYKSSNTMYAKRVYRNRPMGICKNLSMHREILKIDNPDIEVDHIDGNGLNNQKENLRIVTVSQNQANRKSRKKYKGVYKYRVKGRDKNSIYEYWKALCRKDGKQYSKNYKSEKEAAIGYNEMAIKFHGEYAKLNNI